MSAIDDGSNSDYAKGGGASVPVFQAGPMHTSTSYKGGPYSHGYSAERYQYGGMRVTDDGGDEICIEWAAFDDRNEMVRASDTGERLMHRFCLTIKD